MEPPHSHTAPSFYRRPAPGQLRGHVGEVRDAVVSDQHRDVPPFIRMHMHVLFLVPTSECCWWESLPRRGLGVYARTR